MFSMKIIDAYVKLMYAFESPKLNLYSSSYDPFSGTSIDCPVLTPYTVQILGLISGCKKEGIWTRVLHRNYRCIGKLI